MRKFYNSNKDFKDYVDKYCRTYGLTVDEALTHALVKEVKDYYEKRGEDKVEVWVLNFLAEVV